MKLLKTPDNWLPVLGGYSMSENRESLPSLLTIKEAAERLRCSQTNVYGLIDQGLLPYIRVGNAKGYRIDPRDLESFIQERKEAKTVAATKQPPNRPKLKHIKF